MRNAAVLPDPVCAHAIKSFLDNATGMPYRCTGVGFLYPQRSILAASAAYTLSYEKSYTDRTSRGTISTGMLAYMSSEMPDCL